MHTREKQSLPEAKGSLGGWYDTTKEDKIVQTEIRREHKVVCWKDVLKYIFQLFNVFAYIVGPDLCFQHVIMEEERLWHGVYIQNCTCCGLTEHVMKALTYSHWLNKMNCVHWGMIYFIYPKPNRNTVVL